MKRIRVGVGVMMLVGVLIVACQGEQDEPTQELPTIISTATIEARETASATITGTPTQIPSPMPTRFVRETPPIELPASLLIILHTDAGGNEEIWQLGNHGDQRKLANVRGTYMYASPDKTQALYHRDADIWLLDIPTGETRRITEDGTENLELHTAWWADRDGFVMASNAEQCFNGYLTYVGLAGTHQVLDPELKLFAPPAVSPDGSTVAYAGTLGNPCVDAGELRLYREGKPPERIDLSAFGLADHSIRGISWSPDGTRLGLATIVSVFAEQRYQEYILILDLEQRTSRILYEFKKFHTSADQASTPVWSASGDWLVFQTSELLSLGGKSRSALWYADSDEVRRLTTDDDEAIYGFPTISPDDQWVAVPGTGEITFVRIVDGALFSWKMPAQPKQIAWVAAP